MAIPNWMKPPANIGQSGAKHWIEYANDLRAAGSLTPNTVARFEALCRYLAVVDAAMAAIEADGAVVRTASGACRANPAVAILLRTQPLVDELFGQFGVGT